MLHTTHRLLSRKIEVKRPPGTLLPPHLHPRRLPHLSLPIRLSTSTNVTAGAARRCFTFADLPRTSCYLL